MYLFRPGEERRVWVTGGDRRRYGTPGPPGFIPRETLPFVNSFPRVAAQRAASHGRWARDAGRPPIS